jgi:hypothetical protein
MAISGQRRQVFDVLPKEIDLLVYAPKLSATKKGRMRRPPNGIEPRRRSVGTTLLVIFFAAGALICLVTMLALAFPGGLLEPIWRLKPEARVEFQKMGSASVVLMAVVGGACGLAPFGLSRNAEWGRRLAIGVLAVNPVGDSLNALLRHDAKTLMGLPIGGLMILYLLKKQRSET